MSCIKPKSNTVYSPKSDPYENTVADWMNETLKKEPLISVPNLFQPSNHRPQGYFLCSAANSHHLSNKKIIIF